MLRRLLPTSMQLASERTWGDIFAGSAHEALFLNACARGDVATVREILDTPFVRVGVRGMLDSPEFAASLTVEMYAEVWARILSELNSVWNASGLLVSVWSASRVEAPADHLVALAERLEEFAIGDVLNECLQHLWESEYSDSRVLIGASVESVARCLQYAPTKQYDGPGAFDACFGAGAAAIVETLAAEEPGCRLTLRELLADLNLVQQALPLVSHARRVEAAPSLREAIELVASLPATGAGVAAQLVQGGTELSWDELVSLAVIVEHGAVI